MIQFYKLNRVHPVPSAEYTRSECPFNTTSTGDAEYPFSEPKLSTMRTMSSHGLLFIPRNGLSFVWSSSSSTKQLCSLQLSLTEICYSTHYTTILQLCSHNSKQRPMNIRQTRQADRPNGCWKTAILPDDRVDLGFDFNFCGS